MTVLRIILLTIILFRSEHTISQNIETYKFNNSELIYKLNNQESNSVLLSTNCVLEYERDNGLYKFSCIGLDGEEGYQFFKVFERVGENVYARFLFDDSDIKATYLIKDSINMRDKIEFISHKKMKNNEVSLIFRYYNNTN